MTSAVYRGRKTLTQSKQTSSEGSLSATLIGRDYHGKHLRTKVTPDFYLTYSKNGEYGVGIKMIKMNNFQYFSIKSYVLDVH